MSFSSSIRLPAYSKQLKCHSVHERGRNRGRGKENKSRENQHVTSETLSTQKSQVMPRSDQNNNRSARTWIVSPTHKLPPPLTTFFSKIRCTLVQLSKVGFLQHSLLLFSYTTVSFSLITSQNINLRCQYISSHLTSWVAFWGSS